MAYTSTLETIAIEKIRTDAADGFVVDFPISDQQLLSSSWVAAKVKGNSVLTALIAQSYKSPGLFFCRVCLNEATENIRPVPLEMVRLTVEAYLEPYGFLPRDLDWVKSNERASDHPIIRSDEIVYFLKAGEFIKIGKATKDASCRVASFQTGCPYPITVLAEIPGGLGLESRLHKRFKADHFRGEWFSASPALLSYISSIAKG